MWRFHDTPPLDTHLNGKAAKWNCQSTPYDLKYQHGCLHPHLFVSCLPETHTARSVQLEGWRVHTTLHQATMPPHPPEQTSD